MNVSKTKYTPEISVIIPTHKRPTLLKEAIQSVLNQTFKNFELIIVNDGYDKITKNIIFDFNDERIQYIEHEKNKGVSASRNTGVKNSIAKYITFLDDDDMLPPKSLEISISIIKKNADNPRIGGVGGSLLFFIKENNKIKFIQELKPIEGVAKHTTEGGKICIIKKQALKDIGLYDETLTGSEDTDFSFRFFKKYCLVTTQETTYYARRHMGPSLHNKIGAVDDYIKTLKKHNLEFKKYPKKAQNIILRTIGVNLCLEKRMKDGRKYLLASIKKNPLHLKTYIVFIASFFGQSLVHRLYLLNTGIKSSH